MAQRVRRLDDIPKVLPKYRSKNITRAIHGPETYHGQGCIITSIAVFFAKLKLN
jgi:hypothetical protein